MENKLVIFIDSGDTLIDEGTQVYDQDGTVLRADIIEGADELLSYLHQKGYKIALVADGTWVSFQNVLKQNYLSQYFDAWVVSEIVGVQKPHANMFLEAMKKLNLSEEEKKYIVMIGNNLKKDIAGANRFGIISVWLSWSKRYFQEIEEEDWKPEYRCHTKGVNWSIRKNQCRSEYAFPEGVKIIGKIFPMIYYLLLWYIFLTK